MINNVAADDWNHSPDSMEIMGMRRMSGGPRSIKMRK
jgi:hypothetical protein